MGASNFGVKGFLQDDYGLKLIHDPSYSLEELIRIDLIETYEGEEWFNNMSDEEKEKCIQEQLDIRIEDELEFSYQSLVPIVKEYNEKLSQYKIEIENGYFSGFELKLVEKDSYFESTYNQTEFDEIMKEDITEITDFVLKVVNDGYMNPVNASGPWTAPNDIKIDSLESFVQEHLKPSLLEFADKFFENLEEYSEHNLYNCENKNPFVPQNNSKEIVDEVLEKLLSKTKNQENQEFDIER